ncbi:unnamed protein product [Colletotrichum noveboracense]|uniref:Uncharacterized protein n=1 Tax=Colletotrichum noveboracense TaxID=2664923 RepID=A0A9W4WEQ8_9PEZI|nr:unnamed protein product [Colletotrichum noveboracense]
MRFAQIFMLAATISGAFAGKNCKCQDPSGKGPQWNDLTKQCCNGDVNAGCFFAPNFPGPNKTKRAAATKYKDYRGETNGQNSIETD